jgi:hypothetical protein
MTVAQVDQVTDEMKFKSFTLPDKIVEGKKVTKQIEGKT